MRKSKAKSVCTVKNCTNNITTYQYCKDHRNKKIEDEFIPQHKVISDIVYILLLPVGIVNSESFVVSVEDIDLVVSTVFWFNAKKEIVCKKDKKIVKLLMLLGRNVGKMTQLEPGLNYTRNNLKLKVTIIHSIKDETKSSTKTSSNKTNKIIVVPLSNPKNDHITAKIDLNMVNKINESTWALNKSGYAKNSKCGLMHRYVMSLLHGEKAIEGMLVDHINGDRLDNRVCNLRIVNSKQNANNKTNDPTYMGYLGVVKMETSKNTYDYIIMYKHIECKRINIQILDIENEKKILDYCVLHYDVIAKYCKGEYARVNNPNRNDIPIELLKLEVDVLEKLNKIKAKYSQYVGITKIGDKWKASIKFDLGLFEDEKRAAAEYDLAVICFKLDRKLNFDSRVYEKRDIVRFKQKFKLD